MISRLGKLRSMLGPRGRLQFALLVALAVVSGCIQVAGVTSVIPFMALIAKPGLIQTNHVLHATYVWLGFGSTHAFIAATGGLMLVALGVSNGFSATATWYSLWFSQRQFQEMSVRLLRNYACKPYVWHLANNSSSLSRDILSELRSLLSDFITPVSTAIVNSATILLVTGVLIWADPLVALGCSVLMGGGYLVIYRSSRRALGRFGRRRLDAERVRYKVCGELLGGQREARLLHCQEVFVERFSGATAVSARSAVWSGVIGQLPRAGLETVAFATIILMAVYFLYSGRALEQFLPLLSLYAVCGVRLMPPLQALFNAVSRIRFASATVDRLYPELIYSTSPEPPATAPLAWAHEIRLDQLAYSYPESPVPVLDGLSATIPRNSSVAFVGETGAGKTTLINLLLGLLAPSSGAIVVDGRPITPESLSAWQADLGFVPQDIFLCDESVMANIAFGVRQDQIDPEQVRQAARLAQLDSFVEALPQGYDTLVGERGVRLSGGQRQRLGIARALYHDPSVLVLDEATSSLDGRTEQAVMEAFQSLGESKTLIIIAHRLTTLKDCDTIYVLERGQVVDQGTYDELLERNRTFQDFAKITG